ncbi:hypothetical protein M2150_001793 [Lachnospiraceae bacterium PM6-15]|uniref:Hachiman antiphage defense system protein HamA n=1 Tax=Ohessyouella blattaphilus TaxID=2949333 RepID=UPI003E1F4331
MSILRNPVSGHPLDQTLTSNDSKTTSGVEHRELMENGNNDPFVEYMKPAIERHHLSPDALRRHKEMVETLKIKGLSIPVSAYPKDLNTRKGNFAEVVLAEYLTVTTDAELPVYRLRYTTNPEQSLKGDDVLLFDLDSDPVRVIVGESKFRGTPSKAAVVEMVDGLLRSNKAGLPISLMFVANRLFEEGNDELGERVQNCAILFLQDKLEINYVGLLMSNLNAKRIINEHTENKLRNLLVISLGVQQPEGIVNQVFTELEESL